jgi:hypothetical protein
LEPTSRDFKSLPIEEQMILAQSLRDGFIDDLETAEEGYVSAAVDAHLLKLVKSASRETHQNQRLMAHMRAWGH